MASGWQMLLSNEASMTKQLRLLTKAEKIHTHVTQEQQFETITPEVLSHFSRPKPLEVLKEKLRGGSVVLRKTDLHEGNLSGPLLLKGVSLWNAEDYEKFLTKKSEAIGQNLAQIGGEVFGVVIIKDETNPGQVCYQLVRNRWLTSPSDGTTVIAYLEEWFSPGRLTEILGPFCRP